MADATQADAVQLLRQRKHRPSKPFALMYPDSDALAGDVHLSPDAEEAFNSIESPIVLAPLRAEPASGLALNAIAPGLGHIGAMQPYTPFFQLLMQAWGKPIVATSGNLSGSPIYFEDDKAIRSLGRLVDYFVTNDRRIVLPQDDSVIRFSPRHKQRILLRRSRGYAPTMVQQKPLKLNETWLALGAELKSSFAFFHAGNTYVSQYLGDMENFDTQESFRHTLAHLTSLLKASPSGLVADLHPDYFSHRLAQERAEELGIPVITVQHHLAHFAAVLAENEVLDSKDPILGFIWDGTGLGDDRQIWGGECFLFEN
jgi:hydrogenase maturation protein HypF